MTNARTDVRVLDRDSDRMKKEGVEHGFFTEAGIGSESGKRG